MTRRDDLREAIWDYGNMDAPMADTLAAVEAYVDSDPRVQTLNEIRALYDGERDDWAWDVESVMDRLDAEAKSDA